MMKVGIVGIGAAGNNNILAVVEMDEALIESGILEHEDDIFKCQALNSTKFDMEFVANKDVYTKVIGDGDGCGKSRAVSKNLFMKNGKEMIFDLVKELEGSDIVIVIVGLGGGTGSGQIALTLKALISQADSINSKGVIFIGRGILPADIEDGQSLKNAIDAAHELDEIGIAYTLADNSTITDTSIKDMYRTINNSIVEDMRVIRGDFNSRPSNIGNMDKRDCQRLYSTPGLMTINKVSGIKEVYLDKTTIDDLIIKSVKDSYNVQLEKDRVIGKIGVILNITDRMLEKFDGALTKVQEEFGHTPHIFKHINIVDSEEKSSIITILTGLSSPASKFAEMTERINELKDREKRDSSKSKSIKQSTDWMDDEGDIPTIKTESLDDFFNSIG